MPAVLCYGATERNGGRAEAQAGLAECARLARARRPGIAVAVGLHASFTVSDDTIVEAAGLARDLGVVLHVHVAEDGADVADARARGYAGVIDRLTRLGAMIPGSIFAHGVHLTADEVAACDAAGVWLVQNPRSNRGNRVGYPRALAGAAKVALGTDGYPAAMADEVAALTEEATAHGDDPRAVAARPGAGAALLAERFGGAVAAPDAAAVARATDALDEVRARARAVAPALWARIERAVAVSDPTAAWRQWAKMAHLFSAPDSPQQRAAGKCHEPSRLRDRDRRPRVRDRTVALFRERKIILPTLAELAEPDDDPGGPSTRRWRRPDPDDAGAGQPVSRPLAQRRRSHVAGEGPSARGPAVDLDRGRQPDHRRVRRSLPDDHGAQGAGGVRLPGAAPHDRAVRPDPPPRGVALDRQLLPRRRGDLAHPRLPRRGGPARGHERRALPLARALGGRPGDIVRTVGTESNVKEIYDACAELDAIPTTSSSTSSRSSRTT
jgi:hypothetical protein